MEKKFPKNIKVIRKKKVSFKKKESPKSLFKGGKYNFFKGKDFLNAKNKIDKKNNPKSVIRMLARN